MLSDLFIQLDSSSFVMCHVEIFEQIKMDGWIDGVGFLCDVIFKMAALTSACRSLLHMQQHPPAAR